MFWNASSDKNPDPARKALENYISTFEFTKIGGVGDINTLSIAMLEQLAKELGWRAMIKGRVDVLRTAATDSWFYVVINGVQLELPRYTIMTMRHCIAADVTNQILLNVETPHWQRMLDQLIPGSVFLDIGAAAGTMTVPFALYGEGRFKIYSFEPSKRANKVLRDTIARNQASGITVMDYALSDTVGELDFIEIPEDDLGDTPFQPEASRLCVPAENLNFAGQLQYPVEVNTLDNIMDELDLINAEKIVVKIDVEGFEDKVLAGAIGFMRRYKPFLSIDIHDKPEIRNEIADDFDHSTYGDCISILKPLGYSFERIGHVLLAK